MPIRILLITKQISYFVPLNSFGQTQNNYTYFVTLAPGETDRMRIFETQIPCNLYTKGNKSDIQNGR